MDWTEKGVKCDAHKRLCMLKTGIKDGPNYLKSFYICSQPKEPCTFALKASDVHPLLCPAHNGQYAGLQVVQEMCSGKELRKYYRCPEGDKNKSDKNKIQWCGFITMMPVSTSVSDVSSDSNLQGQQEICQDNAAFRLGKKDLSGKKDLNVKKDPASLEGKTSKHHSVPSAYHGSENKDCETSNISPKTQPVSSHQDHEIDGLSAECLGKLSIKDDEDKLRKDTKPHVHEKKSSAFSGSSGQTPCFKDLAKSRSLLDKPLLNPRTKDLINNSMSYRDSSLVEISDDDSNSETEEKEDLQDREGTCEPDSEESLNGSQLKVSHEDHQQPECTDKRSQNDKPQSNVIVPNYNQSESSQTEMKRSTVDEAKDLMADSSLAALKMLSYSSLISKKQGLVKDIDESRKMLKYRLPDGGLKLRDRIERCTKEILQLDKVIEERKNEVTAEKGSGDGSNKPSSISIQPNISNSESSYRQTKLIDLPTSQLSALAYQEMSNGPGHGNLYGGRMTQTRLEHVGHVTSEAIERLHGQFQTCPSSEMEANDPDGLLVPLMKHQRQALAWLTWREEQHPPGGILADDMGLGKTLTIIALVLARCQTDSSKLSKVTWFSKENQKKAINSKATLVICPASLVHQWHKEIERRVKRGLLKVIVYHGTNRETNLNSLASADVVITTYNIISREVGIPEEMKKDKKAQEMPVSDKDLDQSSDGGSLLSIIWNRIVIDEAHNIKNHKSLTAMSVSRLRSTSRWALTGTPIHNDLLDMYSLLRFLRCSPFDEYKLWKRQVDNKTEKGTQRLNTLIKTLLLRRTKDQQCTSTGCKLVPLPEKHSRSHELQLSSQERQLYDRIYKKSRATMQEYLLRQENKLLGKETELSKQKPPPNPWIKDNHLGQGSVHHDTSSASVTSVVSGSSSNKRVLPGGGQMLINLLRLRQCCSHLHLLQTALEADDFNSDSLELDLAEQMNDLALSEATDVKDSVIGDESVSATKKDSPSTKVTALLRELDSIRQQSSREKRTVKSVVVSQWTKMLEIVEYHLERAGYRCCTIKGSVGAKQRSDMVDVFNSDDTGPEIMLVSLRAGGVGLNLIGGNHLFLIDMHWNPALELQACDRIYRVGQKREVFIHRFVCKDTIEEKILQLQKSKTELANNILSGNTATKNKLTLADLRLLFGIDSTGFANFDPRSQFMR